LQPAKKTAVRKAILAFISRLLSILPLAAVRCVFESSLSALHRLGPTWITVHQRPKRGCDGYYLPLKPLPFDSGESCGIVLQGPIHQPDDFTLESIKYYRLLHPNAVVVLSTWDDEPAGVIEQCRAAGAVIVTSSKPAIPGALNVNFQSRSALAGLLKAKELGCRFAAKTRTDVRIYAPDAFSFLVNLLKTFPARGPGQQNFRLIATPVTTARYTPFYLSDILVFGEINDICMYWNCPQNICSRDPSRNEGSIRNLISDEVPEIFLCRSFLTRSRGPIEPTLRNWWQALADHFLIVDREMLDMYWPKYFPHTERLSESYDGVLAWTNVRFRDWLNLQMNFDNRSEVPEHVLELPAMSVPPVQLQSPAANHLADPFAVPS